jgi:hypothetical protein
MSRVRRIEGIGRTGLRRLAVRSVRRTETENLNTTALRRAGAIAGITLLRDKRRPGRLGTEIAFLRDARRQMEDGHLLAQIAEGS